MDEGGGKLTWDNNLFGELTVMFKSLDWILVVKGMGGINKLVGVDSMELEFEFESKANEDAP